MAPILEHQAKRLLADVGIATPSSHVVLPGGSMEGVPQLPVVVKALVPVGKKGKHGAIRRCTTASQLSDSVHELSSAVVRGFPSQGVIVEELVPIASECFLSFTFDGGVGGPVLIASAHGGVDIEEVADRDPKLIVQIPIDPIDGLTQKRAEMIWLDLGLVADDAASVAVATARAWQAFVEFDCTLLELNPLAITETGEVVAVGALVSIDDEALFRHPELARVATYGSGRFGRPATALESEILEIISDGKNGTVRFMELPDGDFINLIQGGGCSLISTDQMYDLGGHPATYFDTTAPSDHLMRTLFRRLLGRDGMRGLVFGFNIASLASVDRRFEILVEVLEEMEIDTTEFPVVVRLAGTGQDRAREIAKRMPGLEYYADECTIEEAIDRFMALLGEHAPAA
jgi:succinyl-CoA synthetase beta subunit